MAGHGANKWLGVAGGSDFFQRRRAVYALNPSLGSGVERYGAVINIVGVLF